MKRLNLLIADDYRQITELSKNLIKNRSNKFNIVDVATSSKEEIEMIEKYSPDIVISDIVRKNEDISGFDIVLKYLEEEKNIKFILCTARTKEELLREYQYDKMPSNVIGYFQKPFSWDYFISEIEHLCH